MIVVLNVYKLSRRLWIRDGRDIYLIISPGSFATQTHICLKDSYWGFWCILIGILRWWLVFSVAHNFLTCVVTSMMYRSPNKIINTLKNDVQHSQQIIYQITMCWICVDGSTISLSSLLRTVSNVSSHCITMNLLICNLICSMVIVISIL